MIAELLRRIIPERLRPIGYLTHLVRGRTNNLVAQGPFAGMRLIPDSVSSAYLPKLLGIYERELNPCVETICKRKPELIVDVGAAEGYYAVGLARRNPQARVVGFEMEEHGQRALCEMAELNSVTRKVEIRGKCEPHALALALMDVANPVVICDVEGYEETLLEPITIPALRRATVLVELHDFIVPRIARLLKSRFQSTHQIEHIWQESRSRADFPFVTLYTRCAPKSYLDWAVSEWRPERMSWLWMEPERGATR